MYFVGPRTSPAPPTEQAAVELIAPIFSRAPSPSTPAARSTAATTERIRIGCSTEKILVELPVSDTTNTNRVLVYDTREPELDDLGQAGWAPLPGSMTRPRHKQLLHPIMTDSSFQLQRLEEYHTHRRDPRTYLGFSRSSSSTSPIRDGRSDHRRLWHRLQRPGEQRLRVRHRWPLTCGGPRQSLGRRLLTPTTWPAAADDAEQAPRGDRLRPLAVRATTYSSCSAYQADPGRPGRWSAPLQPRSEPDSPKATKTPLVVSNGARSPTGSSTTIGASPRCPEASSRWSTCLTAAGDVELLSG